MIRTYSVVTVLLQIDEAYGQNIKTAITTTVRYPFAILKQCAAKCIWKVMHMIHMVYVRSLNGVAQKLTIKMMIDDKNMFRHVGDGQINNVVYKGQNCTLWQLFFFV